MAPSLRSRSKPPTSRTYHSSSVPTQVRFPPRQKAVKSYGQGSSSARSLRQQTLTQINYIHPAESEPPEVLLEDEERPQKRRKTMGDTPSSSFHTQTLTQLLSEKGEDSGDLWQIRDSDDDEEELETELPEIGREEPTEKSGKLQNQSRQTSIIPQTPSHRKTRVDLTEVPSSQSTPVTPAPAKCFISPIRSPLAEKSLNIKVPTPGSGVRVKRPRSLVVQDSYSSVTGSWPLDQTQSPAKAGSPTPVRPYSGVAQAGAELDGTTRRRSEAGDEIPALTPTASRRRALIEIPDSDAELESLGPSPEKGRMLTETPKAPSPNADERTLRAQTPEVHESQCDDGDETSSEGPGTPTPIARKTRFDSPMREQKEVPREEVTIASSPDPDLDPLESMQDIQGKPEVFTQGLESQRVPLEIIKSMGPQTDRSDVIISMHPGPVEEVAKGTKNHEFRNYKIPPQVSRIWIYVTHPICELRYMATIGPARQPGEIDSDSGVANADFNSGKSGYKFAHELLQVYQLNNPVSLQMMKENGWVGSPPQKYTYVPPAVVGQLLANLRCALFDENPEEDDPGMSISQELEEQLRSDIIHSTQLASDGHEAAVPSSQGLSPKAGRPSTERPDAVFPKPSLPSSVRNQWHRTPTRGTAPAIRPSQATTASEPSSPVHSPEKSVPRPTLSSGPSLPHYVEAEDGSSLLKMAAGGGFSLGSSQLMLPDSLLVDDARPPPVVLDSDGEDYDG